MNSNFVIFVLILIIIFLYYSKQTQPVRQTSAQICNRIKISPSKFNPAIHHPAML